MNYTWTKITEYGQYENGFVDIYETKVGNNKIVAIINYLVQFNDEDQRVLTTLLLEGDKKIWTEGKVKDAIYDCEDRVRNVSNFKFRNFTKLDYMTIQTLYFNKIGDIQFGTNGDFSFEEPIDL